MYMPCFLQVVCPYFEKIKIKKIKKESKSPKRKIKGLKKIYRPQKKKMKIKHESVQVQMPLLFIFCKWLW